MPLRSSPAATRNRPNHAGGGRAHGLPFAPEPWATAASPASAAARVAALGAWRSGCARTREVFLEEKLVSPAGWRD